MRIFNARIFTRAAGLCVFNCSRTESVEQISLWSMGSWLGEVTDGDKMSIDCHVSHLFALLIRHVSRSNKTRSVQIGMDRPTKC